MAVLMTISSHIFENYNYTFHKSEVQVFILRCRRDLLNWFKSYDTSEKYAKIQKTQKTIHKLRWFFLQNHKKRKIEIFVFCVITFDPTKIPTCSTPKNDRLNLSFAKNIIVVFKNMARIGHKTAICQL